MTFKVNFSGEKAAVVDAYLGVDDSKWLSAGETPAGVARALVGELGHANDRDADWTIDVLTDALEQFAEHSNDHR